MWVGWTLLRRLALVAERRGQGTTTALPLSKGRRTACDASLLWDGKHWFAYLSRFVAAVLPVCTWRQLQHTVHGTHRKCGAFSS